jgi:hypothetical protein
MRREREKRKESKKGARQNFINFILSPGDFFT